MRVLVVAVGSLGDVAPCAGLGQALAAAGHRVTIAAYEMFSELVTGCGLGFRALPGDPHLLEAAQWERGGTGPLGTARLLRLTADHMRELHSGMLAAARQDADVLLLQGVSAIGGYHIAEGLGLPSMGLGLQPIYPTRDFPPSTVTARSFGPLGNRAIGQALIALGSPVLAGPVKELRAELGLPRLGTWQAVFGQQAAARWPAFHGFSPAVVPRPADWREGLEVSGYWWPPRQPDWHPPAGLKHFLADGPPPVFVGFGSMRSADPARLSENVAAAGKQAGVRLVIQTGQAGLAQASQSPDDWILIGDVPHDWLFPQMAAVIHHAGAGTTAAGLRAGVPAVTVPKIGDQPFWAARLAALGAAPRPVPYKRLSAAALAAAILEATTRPSYRVQAQALAGRLAGEDGTRPVIEAVSRLRR
jgi:sterol 3beta-glucosyltransferase